MASTIKVDNVQNQPGTNIVSKCGTDVTLGASGDTVALACGASQTGFGRTGTVDWVTTPKVTGDSPVTAATGSGYFLNTTAGTITVNLPAGAAGSIVSVADYAGTWQTNNVTVAANGSEKIGGIAQNATLNTQGQSVTFVYVDSTQGWINTMDSTSNVRGEVFVVATGGTPCAGQTCGNYKYHTFTGPGTFCVSQIAACAGNNVVDYLVIAGGGAGGTKSSGTSTGEAGGAGGAGGYRESPGTSTGCYGVSPRGAAPAVALPVAVAGYPVTVGGGGTAASPYANNCLASARNGSDSVFAGTTTITSAGGGGGGSRGFCAALVSGGANGGSGGGGSYYAGPGGPHGGKSGGTGNTPSTNPVQGTDGGTRTSGEGSGGGGGGAICAGGGAGCGPTAGLGGAGGTGATSSINGTPTARAGGGGGGGNKPGYPGTGGPGAAGPGGGGAGADRCSPTVGVAGTVNLGGGGGGASGCAVAGGGGSGLVIIRYKFQ